MTTQGQLGTSFDVMRYLRLFWRRKWLVVVPAVVFPLASGYYAMQLPDRYKSSTLILVQPQKVPTKFVPSTVTTSIEDRLHTISQQIFSRTRLEQIINEFNLFEKERKTKAPEEIIALMRSRIRLKVHKKDAFELSYIDANPRLAMLVTNKLASLFIEENLKVREQQAIGTSQFLEDEIERYRERIREKEKVIYEFKKKYMSELPEQLASNQSRLNQLQNQLQINTQNINAAEGRKLQLQQQIAEIERRVQEDVERRRQEWERAREEARARAEAPASATPAPGTGTSQEIVLPIDREIEKLRHKLDELLTVYTEKHPDVVRLKSRLAQLEAEAERQRAERLKQEEMSRNEAAATAGVPSTDSMALEPPDLSPRYPPVYDKLKAELARVTNDLEKLREQNEKIQKAIEIYQKRIAATPARQLQLQQLTEDYDNLKRVLESLIDKKLQADLAENLERKQKGEQFKILDPANLPEKPFYPNRLRYVFMGLAAGLALGVGLVLLVDFLDTSVKTKTDLEQAAGAPVLSVIPEIVTPATIRRRWAIRLGVAASLAVCTLAAAMVIHVKVKPIPEAVSDLYSQIRNTHWTTVK